MKYLKLIMVGMVLFLATTMQGQISVSINIPAPPRWGPPVLPAVNFYFLPDVDAYYDIRSHMFIYYSGSAWVHRASLPPRYKDYDLYRGHKVIMNDYRGSTPYKNYKEHKMKYSNSYHGEEQKSHGEKQGKGNSHNDKGNKGGDKGHGNGKNK